MKLSKTNSAGKRLLVSVFLAAAAGGLTFYLIMFVGLMATLFTSGTNPAQAPGLNGVLRMLAVPVCLVVAVLAFVAGQRRRVAPTDFNDIERRDQLARSSTRETTRPGN